MTAILLALSMVSAGPIPYTFYRGVECLGPGGGTITGDLVIEGTLTVSGQLSLDSDNVCFAMGAALETDFCLKFDGTDARYYTSGSHRFDAPVIAGRFEITADSGSAVAINHNCTSALADGDPCDIYFTLDNSGSAFLGITSLADGADGVDTFELKVPEYTVDYVQTAGSVALGPTAPSNDTNDSCFGKGFDAVGEIVDITFEVPNCYTDATTSDIELNIYWCPTSGDAPADTEDVQFDISYRSIQWGVEDADNGTLATGTVTYTQSGAGNDKQTFISTITLDADDANQAIDVGDTLAITFNRDLTNETNSYSGKAIVAEWEIEVPQDQLICDHQ